MQGKKLKKTKKNTKKRFFPEKKHEMKKTFFFTTLGIVVCQDFKLGGHEEGSKYMNSPNYSQIFLFRGNIISFRIVKSAGGTTDDALFPFLILSQNGS